MAAAVLAGGLVSARAQLATMSPFLPPQSAPGGATPTADAPLEFRGVAELPDGTAFRVVDPARKTGAWLRLNERDPDLGVVVKQSDPVHDTVTVEHQGRTLTLALHQAKVTSAGAAMPMVAMPPPPMQMNGGPIAPAAPIPQAQLDAVAAAVAQRRALRAQAAQQAAQGAQLAPGIIQQQQAQAAAAQNGQTPANGQATQNGQRGQRRNRQQQRPD